MEKTEEPLAFSMSETLHLQVPAGCCSVAFIDQARSLVATGGYSLQWYNFYIQGAGKRRQLPAVLLLRGHISG